MLGRLINSALVLATGPATRGATSVAAAALRVPAAALALAPEVLDRLIPAATAAERAASRVASTATGLPSRAAAAAATAARQGRSLVDKVGQEAGPASRALLDLGPGRARRRAWAVPGHAHIEVRGMTGSGSTHRRVAAGVTRRLRSLRGVRWAQVNAVTGQVLVAFEEGRVDVGTLLDTVRDVERAQGTREENFSWSRPVHPADPTPVAAAGVELAADCVALATAIGGRIVGLTAVPRAVRVAHALLEIEPPLRRRLKRRIGPIGTDVVLALAAAAVQGLSQNPGGPAVDALYRLELLAETVSRRAVWERREDELCCMDWTLPAEAPQRPPRPVPRPDGPIEAWTARLGSGTLVAAGAVLGLTRSPGRAAETILVAVPKAARLGREGFATTVGRELSRRGVLPLNAAAWRRLDRVSAVVLDSPVLCTDRPWILAAEPVPGVDAAAVWQGAEAALDGRSTADLAGDGPWERGDLRLERADGGEPGAVRLRLRRGDRVLGEVSVAGELHPHADALVDAARRTGARVLLTEHSGVAELVGKVDDVLHTDRPLAEHVRRLQQDGHGVLVVSAADDQALAVADVGVTMPGGDRCVCWSADLLCRPGLDDPWRILSAVAAARPVSERALQLAQAGSALGALLALVGARRSGRSHAMTPVYGAAAVALVQGTVAGLAATRRRMPALVTHVPWHALDVHDVLARLDADRSEPASEPEPGRLPAAAARLREFGDRLPGAARMAVPARAGLRFAGAIKEELRDPLTPVLAVGAVASAIVGSGFDTMLVAAVMGGNALISGVQRIRAERALRRLFSEQEIVARRLRRSRRDGTAAETVAGLEAVPLETVPASALSPGDVIALRASDVVPADARLLSAADLEVDESTLTGESIPVTKGVERVDVVCLDKTGTLTQGRLAVTGVTSFETDLERDHPRARRLLVTAARACPRVDPARIHTVPHATDRAVLEAATGQGDHHENWRLRTELPFETNRGYAAALGEAGDEPLLAVKGAPEVVLPRCATVAVDDTGTEPLTDERRRTAQHTVQHLAADGLRVLAVAERQREQPGDDVADGDVADLTLLGFVGVADTPRPDAADAVRRITGDGIRMVMVTGDHPATAAAIARMVGMPADSVLTGADLDRMPEEERNRRVSPTSVSVWRPRSRRRPGPPRTSCSPTRTCAASTRRCWRDGRCGTRYGTRCRSSSAATPVRSRS